MIKINPHFWHTNIWFELLWNKQFCHYICQTNANSCFIALTKSRSISLKDNVAESKVALVKSPLNVTMVQQDSLNRIFFIITFWVMVDFDHQKNDAVVVFLIGVSNFTFIYSQHTVLRYCMEKRESAFTAHLIDLSTTTVEQSGPHTPSTIYHKTLAQTRVIL